MLWGLRGVVNSSLGAAAALGRLMGGVGEPVRFAQGCDGKRAQDDIHGEHSTSEALSQTPAPSAHKENLTKPVLAIVHKNNSGSGSAGGLDVAEPGPKSMEEASAHFLRPRGAVPEEVTSGGDFSLL